MRTGIAQSIMQMPGSTIMGMEIDLSSKFCQRKKQVG